MKRRLGRGLYDIGAQPPVAGRAASDRPETAGPGGPRAAVFCITSGKGGTGKSVLTSNLAVYLASVGTRVLAIDADMGLANLHLLLGIQPSRTIMEVIESGARLSEVSEVGPVGMRLAAGGSGRADMADLHPNRLSRLVAALDDPDGRADIVLVDTGAGIGRATTTFLYALSDILVVVTPDLTSMTDGYAVIKNVARNNPGARLSVVVNRVGSPVEGFEVFGRLEQVSQRYLARSLHYLGHVLDDQRIGASIAARLPILLNQPASPAAACFRGIGRSLLLDIRERQNGRSAGGLGDRGSGCA